MVFQKSLPFSFQDLIFYIYMKMFQIYVSISFSILRSWHTLWTHPLIFKTRCRNKLQIQNVKGNIFFHKNLCYKLIILICHNSINNIISIQSAKQKSFLHFQLLILLCLICTLTPHSVLLRDVLQFQSLHGVLIILSGIPQNLPKWQSLPFINLCVHNDLLCIEWCPQPY